MKKIEVVMNNQALDTFKDSAEELGISEFEVAEPRRSSDQLVERQRHLRSKTTVKFAVFDEQVKRVLHVLLITLHPDSISIFKIDKAANFDRGSLANETVRLVRRGAAGDWESLLLRAAA